MGDWRHSWKNNEVRVVLREPSTDGNAVEGDHGHSPGNPRKRPHFRVQSAAEADAFVGADVESGARWPPVETIDDEGLWVARHGSSPSLSDVDSRFAGGRRSLKG